MMNNLSSRPRQAEQGFTIIEVLIVLAIAGLIALLIFLAVPTLLRNSRNGERKNGVSSVLRALSHYELNNSGSMPPPCGLGSCFGNLTFTQSEKLTYYSAAAGGDAIVCVGTYASGSLVFSGPAPCTAGPAAAEPPTSNVDTVVIYNYQRCDTVVSGGGTSVGAGYSDVIALFALEGGSGSVSECQQL